MKNLKINIIFASLLLLTSCQTMDKVMVYAGEVTGDKRLLNAGGEMTPRQAYFLGRTISAKIIAAHPIIPNEDLDKYVNTLGHYLALHSRIPETFKGYQFAVIKDDAPTAMSAPGGYIFISMAMIKFCQNEDELAAVIAHEIGHISLKHAEKAIKKTNSAALVAQLAKEAASSKGATSPEIYALFDKGVEMVLNKSFEQPQELEADKESISILTRSGFSVEALYAVLARMKDNTTGFGHHPSNAARLAQIPHSANPEQAVTSKLSTGKVARFAGIQKIK